MTLKCFHQLFEAQFAAGMATDTIAVEFGDDVVTYDAFNRSANRLAHHLMACGIGPLSRRPFHGVFAGNIHVNDGDC